MILQQKFIAHVSVVVLASVVSISAMAASYHDQLKALFSNAAETRLPTSLADLVGNYTGLCYASTGRDIASPGTPVDPSRPMNCGLYIAAHKPDSGPMFPEAVQYLITASCFFSSDTGGGMGDKTSPAIVDAATKSFYSMTPSGGQSTVYDHTLRVRSFINHPWLAVQYYVGMRGSYYPQMSDTDAYCYFFEKKASEN